ncbi:hypothetical protein PAXRUDRAFT_826544 [Paxillus rubicundulus Ve08.2h10]|uniref:Uncharacterized protein n=1 Tax=Paxillus rubicundulus Ve08.2h10 TaxID=930991 RepID=A0A0D0DZE4_9AGAM|nr:hypothetical protein PAXRUDRAFT_826544 [Paxillus rubicundulus Ve08.2h10]
MALNPPRSTPAPLACRLAIPGSAASRPQLLLLVLLTCCLTSYPAAASPRLWLEFAKIFWR